MCLNDTNEKVLRNDGALAIKPDAGPCLARSGGCESRLSGILGMDPKITCGLRMQLPVDYQITLNEQSFEMIKC